MKAAILVAAGCALLSVACRERGGQGTNKTSSNPVERPIPSDLTVFIFTKATEALTAQLRTEKDENTRRLVAREYYRLVYSVWFGAQASRETASPIVPFSIEGHVRTFWKYVKDYGVFDLTNPDDPMNLQELAATQRRTR